MRVLAAGTPMAAERVPTFEAGPLAGGRAPLSSKCSPPFLPNAAHPSFQMQPALPSKRGRLCSRSRTCVLQLRFALAPALAFWLTT